MSYSFAEAFDQRSYVFTANTRKRSPGSAAGPTTSLAANDWTPIARTSFVALPASLPSARPQA